MSAPPAPGGYHTRLADLGRDRDAIIALWHRHLGDPAHRAAKFDWFYANNPFGAALIQLLYHGDTLIGCCGVAPRRMLWQGREIRAGLLADMAVAPNHRTLGPALMLQEALIDAARPHFDLLYGFPNPRSLPVVVRLGYTPIGEMTRHSRVLRSAPYLQRWLPRWLAVSAGTLVDSALLVRDHWRELRSTQRLVGVWASTADARMDATWQASPGTSGLAAIRDTALLRWRFDASPLANVRYLLMGGTSDGPLRAWFACQAVGNVLRVCDWWNAAGGARIDPAMALALVQACRRGGHTSISLACTTATEHLDGLVSAGFVARENQPIVGKWLHAEGATALQQAVHLTEVDEDE